MQTTDFTDGRGFASLHPISSDLIRDICVLSFGSRRGINLMLRIKTDRKEGGAEFALKPELVTRILLRCLLQMKITVLHVLKFVPISDKEETG